MKSFIPDRRMQYIYAMLEDGNPVNVKNGLQQLCSHMRNQAWPRDPVKLRTSLHGILYQRDPKVQRWALNALALVGSQACVVPVAEAISRYRNDIEVTSAGVAALFSLSTPEKAEEILKLADIPLEGAVLLEAAQFSAHGRDKVRQNRVNIDTASIAALRSAAILVGLGKAPENLFSLNHENSEIIGELNAHPDSIISQYSIWAIVENPDLNIGSLRISVKDIEALRPNVRGWLYRLICSDSETAQKERDIVVVGTKELSYEARDGLASGFKETFFAGVDEIAVNWMVEEMDPVILNKIIEHMAFNSEKTEHYSSHVREYYAMSPKRSIARERIAAAAEGKLIYTDLRKIELLQDAGTLFPEMVLGGTTVNQTFNIGGNVGALAAQGHIIDNDISMVQQAEMNGNLKDFLTNVLSFAAKSIPNQQSANDIRDAVKAVVNEPKKGAFEKLMNTLRLVKDGIGYVASAEAGMEQLVHNGQHLLEAF